MKLICDPLKTELFQTVVRDKNTILVAVRPHLYRQLWPVGKIRAVVRDEDDNVLSYGPWQDLEEIGTKDFFHGYVTLYVNAYLRRNTPYRIVIESDETYQFTEPAYVGICQGYDLGRYPPAYDAGTSGFRHPYDIEIWQREP